MKNAVRLIIFYNVLLVTTVQAQSCVQVGTWKLVWHDEFDSTAINPHTWTFDTGTGIQFKLIGWGNNELEYYTTRIINATVSDSNLLIIARKESYMGDNYTSARLKTQGLQNFTYGKIEARMKLPSNIAKGQGLWPAFWMLGDTNITWAGNGELDIMETINSIPEIHGTAHWGKYPNDSASTGDTMCKNLTGYHLYTIIWCDSSVTWFIDNVEYFQYSNINHAFKTPFKEYILLNMAVGGNWPGNPNDSTKFPDTMYVDYVRVYEKMQINSIEGNRIEENSISIFPQPTGNNATLYINDAQKGEYTITIADLAGRTCYQKYTYLTNEGNARIPLSVNELSSGMYIISVINKGKCYYTKLVKE